MIDPVVARLGVAALAGLAVGIEREWSGHAAGPDARFAGLRTFTLLGGIGGVAGWLAEAGAVALAVTLAAGACALVVAAYILAARRSRSAIEGTTEVAAVLIVALGVLAGLGRMDIAGGSAALIVLVLSEKQRLHRAVRKIGEEELRAALQFAVLALVVLPLLPDETFGPLGGVNPRSLWIVVLLFSGLSFAGYLARKAVGASRGYGLAGAIGGAISSTAVTLTFARKSKANPALSGPLATGVAGACVVLMPRLIVLSLVLNPRVAWRLVSLFAIPFVVGIVVVGALLWWQRGARHEKAEDELRNPLGLWTAIRMALAFQAALMLVAWVRQQVGLPGVLPAAALIGFTDMDALNIAMNRLGDQPESVALAAVAIGVGTVSNTVLKLGLALTLGSPAFRRLAAVALLALGAATVAGILVVR
jgi:uncharacterized membrane protein (DUF4010 family)